MKKKKVLISVFDKKGVATFAKRLEHLGWEIISTGGTRKILTAAKIKVTPIEKITGSPEILGGRVKTISYKIAAGLLFDREDPKHVRQINKLKIKPIDMVVCNLYPFEETIKDPKNTLEQALEMIDIGGVTLLRAAAKNFKSVIVVPDPKYYDSVIDELEKKGDVSLGTRGRLASVAFWRVSDYDGVIDSYLAKRLYGEEVIKLNFCEGRRLRYGENPHLVGWSYQAYDLSDPLAIAHFKILQGKELSFNNILDVSAAVDTISEIGRDEPSCIIVKHNSPAGGSAAKTIEKAYEEAWYGGDPLAAFGGVVAVNREVNEKLASRMLVQRGQKKFFEVLIAPVVDRAALKNFSQRKNLIILTNKNLKKPRLRRGLDYKFIRGGVLKQDFDSKQIKGKDLTCVTKKKPTKKQVEDLLFAWKMVKVSKSNAVAIVKNQTLISSGVGQQDRKEACRLAVSKATDPVGGKNKRTPIEAVAASDAFFPFPDGPGVLIKTGVKAIIQPGGSIRDKETIELCNRKGVAMVFTKVRCFNH